LHCRDRHECCRQRHKRRDRDGARPNCRAKEALKALAEAKKVYEKEKIDGSTLAKRVAHVVQSSFAGKRIVVFSGGPAKDVAGIYDEARAIRDGGANGSIIGRNTFQRSRAEALAMLDEIIKIYLGKA